MAIDLDLAVDRLRPGAAFLPNGDRTAIAEWRDAQPQPAQTELQAASDAALAELAAAATAATTEKDQLRAIYVALRDGTGTATQRLVRLEQVVAWLMRRETLGG